MEAYLDNTLRWIKEVYRVLKPSGSFVLNLGGCYLGGGSSGTSKLAQNHESALQRKNMPKGGYYKAKQFLDVSAFAYARIITETDFICRNRGVWCKPNVPSPIRTRLKQSWEAVDWYVKDADNYYFDEKPWLKTISNTSKERSKNPVKFMPGSLIGKRILNDKEAMNAYKDTTIEHSWRVIPVGEKQKGFELNGKEAQEHIAPFPEALIQPWIKSLCPEKVCEKCGKPPIPIFKNTGKRTAEEEEELKRMSEERGIPRQSLGLKIPSSGNRIYVGENVCNCGVGFIAGTVFDPFLGSGTTMKIARDTNRSCMGIELNAKYAEYAKSRINWANGIDGHNYI